MKKKKQTYAPQKKLYVCPRCMDYHYSIKRSCAKCGCTKCLTSVLRKQPLNLEGIPKEDWIRIISYRETNGYDYMKYEKYYKVARILGVRIPRDDKPSYVMKELRPPKAQRGGFTGIANHAGVSGYVHSVNGGGCVPK